MARAANVKTRRIVKPLGKAWGKSLQDIVVKAAQVQARFELRQGKHADKAEVEVVVPVTVHMVFPRKGRSILGDGGVRCNCAFSVDANGGSACICIDPGAASCDCAVA